MSSPILSPAETIALQDSAFFITKATIDAKISDLFVALKLELENLLQSRGSALAPELLVLQGRQYRGEHLEHLPWRALDCPRHFAGEHMFCFRTLLVWGREFSFHLLLGGQWHARYAPMLLQSQQALGQAGWLLSTQDSPWDWRMDPAHYQALSALSATAMADHIAARSWLKLSIAHPLAAIDAVPDRGTALFASLLDALQ